MLTVALLMVSFQLSAQCTNTPIGSECNTTLEETYSDMQLLNGCYYFWEATKVICTNSLGVTSSYLKNVKFVSSVSSTGAPCPLLSQADLIAMIKSKWVGWVLIDYSQDITVEMPCMKYIEVVPNQRELQNLMANPGGCFSANICSPNGNGNLGTLALLVPCSDVICCNWDAASQTMTPGQTCTDDGKYNAGMTGIWTFKCTMGRTMPLGFTVVGDLTPCGPWCSLSGVGSVAGQPGSLKAARSNQNGISANSNSFDYKLTNRVLKLSTPSLIMQIMVTDVNGKVIHQYQNSIPAQLDLSKNPTQIILINGKDVNGKDFSTKVMVD